eukprot:TRINITY_DN9946_c0_g3_i1.p2 TRINITY_DN9946_c0_g3~~TRINITY_DN9946_c0_g3_i1.p2  ORF type:complete len:880 (+),score=198.21 TRINITY_DN9946_c0_g3_i1:3502-6141(+)
MGFLTKLFGSSNVGREALQKLVEAIKERDTVPADVLENCFLAANLDDAVEAELDHCTMLDLATAHPSTCCDVAAQCLAKLEEGMNGSDAKEDSWGVAMGNSAALLARILGVAHSARPTTQEMETGESPPAPSLLDALWERDSFQADGLKHVLSVPERIIVAAMRFLFQDDLCVSLPRKEVEVDGIDVSRLWRLEVGVGPGAPEDLTSQPENDSDLEALRTIGLNLLICALVGQAPFVAADAAAADDDEADTTRTCVAAACAVIAANKPRPLSDTRLLTYLVDPLNDVPFREELFFSLLSSVFSYAPTSSVPFASMFSSDDQDDFVDTCLQVLCLLLHDHAEHDAGANNLLKWFPQESLDKKAPTVLGVARRHIFRELVSNIRGGNEASFLVEGVGAMLEPLTSSTIMSTSDEAPPFLCELLVVVLHLAVSDMFIKAICAEDEASSIVAGLFMIMDEEPEHVDKDVLALLVGATVLRLTAVPTMYQTLVQEYKDDIPDDIINFKGSCCDLIALVALQNVSDRLSTSLVVPMHGSIVEVYLAILVNLSTFAEGFSTAVCHKMFAQFERCSKVSQVKKGAEGPAKYLPMFVETLQNVVQYQYYRSPNVVYGMMTRQSTFDDLMNFVSEEVSGRRLLLESEEATSPTADEKAVAVTKRRLADAALWSELQERLAPLVSMIAAVVPALEAAIENEDIHNPEAAKDFLPNSVLGLLPVPHAFALRSIGSTSHLNRACEICVLVGIAHGPLGGTWDMTNDSATADAMSKKDSKAEGNVKTSQSSGRDGKKDGTAERSRRSRSATSRGGAAVKDAAANDERQVIGGNARSRNSSRTRRVGVSASEGGGDDTSTTLEEGQLEMLHALAAKGLDMNALLASYKPSEPPA